MGFERIEATTDHRWRHPFLPGSRQSEVRNLADTYIATAANLHERHPEARFLVPLATRETRLLFEEALRRHAHLDLPIRILFGHAVEAMIAADVVLVASGTASLEAALLKRPMVITYKIGKWSYRLMRRLAYLPWVGLPNVLAGREVVPEVLQDAATPQARADALDGWLADPARVEELTRVFTDMHLQLRQDTAAKAAAAGSTIARNWNTCCGGTASGPAGSSFAARALPAVMNTPLPGCERTRPSASSVEIASRKAARLIPRLAASSRCPGRQAPLAYTPSWIWRCRVWAATLESLGMAGYWFDWSDQS